MFPFSLYETVKGVYTWRSSLDPAERYRMLHALENALINPEVERFMLLIAEANRRLHPEEFRARLTEQVMQFRQEFEPLIRLMGMDDERLEASLTGAPAWYVPFRRMSKCGLCFRFTRQLSRRIESLAHESAYDLIPLDEFNSAVWQSRTKIAMLYAMSAARVIGIDLSRPAESYINSIVGVWSSLLSASEPA